jgi:hypothetical protein
MKNYCCGDCGRGKEAVIICPQRGSGGDPHFPLSCVSDNYLAILDSSEKKDSIICLKCDTGDVPSAWEKNEDRCPNCRSILGQPVKCADGESFQIGLRITTRTQSVIAEARSRQLQ